jgi:hypothetical protein
VPGRRKKQGLRFWDRHPKRNKIIIIKEKKATKVDCLACKGLFG